MTKSNDKTDEDGLNLRGKNTIGFLYPEGLWDNFFDLTQIPRPSGHERICINFIKKFVEILDLRVIEDRVGNLTVYKPATLGMENCKLVILQAHMDIVPQKNAEKIHDFLKDPIEPHIDGDWVKANGTTLGADNGIGVAAALAILQSDEIQHGPLMCLFTVDEETGMTGASSITKDLLPKEAILINLDSEDEGELCIGCAGGVDVYVTFKYSEESALKAAKAFKVSLSGLKGGHSGVNINLGRANSNKVVFEFLKNAGLHFNLELSSVAGGDLKNAIPREAYAVVVVPTFQVELFTEFVKDYEAKLVNEFSEAEPGLRFNIVDIDLPQFVMDSKAKDNFIYSICAIQNGVICMDENIPGMVKTSSNLGIIELKDGVAKATYLVRSSDDSSKENFVLSVSHNFKTTGAEINVSGGYPGWNPDTNSEILFTSKRVYKEMFEKEVKVYAVHAGLECGFFGGIYPKWDMISFGPTIRFAHSPDEEVEINSVGRFWDFLIEVLKNVPLVK